jgi:hypothetical protein
MRLSSAPASSALDRLYWLQRFTLEEIRELAEGIWGSPRGALLAQTSERCPRSHAALERTAARKPA